MSAAAGRPAPPAVAADRLEARYPAQHVPALDSLTFDVPPGQRLLVVGPNGAGKSTLLRVLAGLMRPSGGSVLVAGEPPTRARAGVGYLGHQPLLYDELTPDENLRLYATLYGAPQTRERARAALEGVGLSQRAHDRVGMLSRGQQQRVALARAVVHDPPLLLLDEPDNGLDVRALEGLARAIAQPARTVIFTTHNLPAGAALATAVALLVEGRLIRLQAGQPTPETLRRWLSDATGASE